MIIVAIILPIIATVIKLMIDYRLWLRSKPVKHKLEWIIMAASCSPSVIIFMKESPLQWYYAAPLSALMVALFIWLLFDGLYNKVRGFDWWFTGSNDKDDAITDNLLQRLKPWQHVVLKIVPLVLSIAFYIISLRLFLISS